MEGTERDDQSRPTTMIWAAELAHRLVVDYGERAIVATTGKLMFNLLAIGAREDARAVHFLSQFGELALRELAGGAVSDELWKNTRLEIRDAFKHSERRSPFYRSLQSALEASFTSESEGLVALVEDVVHAYHGFDTEDESGSIAALEQLFAGVLTATKLRTAIGRPAHSDVRTALCALAQVIANAKGDAARNLAWWNEAGEVSLDQFHERLSRNRQQVDEIAVQRHVDELLQVDADDRRGLALSGGGFRAACFHLGVLARMAERDDLRRTDVISCVSGGSIAGAGYAVRLKALLASKNDLDITREDYIGVVDDLIATLCSLMRSNLRMRAIASPVAVLKLWLVPDHTFSERVAELLDDGLFAPLMAGKHPRMRDMTAHQLARFRRRGKAMTRPGMLGRVSAIGKASPIGWPLGPWDLDAPPFGVNPDFDSTSDANRIRHAKVPEMAFNTTSVNTGAAFRFLPQAHGERPDPHAASISNRPRWTWMRYENLEAGLLWNTGQLTLARVVAASASVPGILPPILIRRFGQDALIALTDGGVFDNQGVDHLWDARCDRVLVSDAAGQLAFEPHPAVSAWSLMLRATDMLMERVRELGYKRLIDAAKEHRLRAFTHLHLTKDLADLEPQPAFRLDGAIQGLLAAYRSSEPTTFGVPRGVQAMLARVRTDLDCFSDLEIHSLMLDGYLQAKASERTSTPGTGPAVDQHSWTFLAAEPLMTAPTNGRLLSILEAGRHRFLRLPRLAWSILVSSMSRKARHAIALGLLGALILVAWSIVPKAVSGLADSQTMRWVVTLVGAYLALAMMAARLPPSQFSRWALKLLAGPLLLGAMLYSWLVLVFADPIYRALGRSASKISLRTPDTAASATKT
jgi:NTE family protein